MREDTKDKLVDYIVGDASNISAMVADMLCEEVDEFVECVNHDMLGETISESTIASNSEETIAKLYKEKVKETAIHELTELYVKIEMLAKHLGYDIKSQTKAYMVYRKHYKK